MSVQSLKLEDVQALLSQLSVMYMLIIWLYCKISTVYSCSWKCHSTSDHGFQPFCRTNVHVLLHGSDFTWMKILPPNILEYIVKLSITVVSNF
jgi:hypothetical protein